MSSDIVGVLLAAGMGRRFGGDKLSARLGNDESIALKAVRTLSQGVDRVVAVVRSDCDGVGALLASAGFTVVICDTAHLGMGHSLACGVHAACDADGWLIALADMPWIQAATIRQLASRLRQGSAIVAPEFNGLRGHPVGFARRFRAELEALSGDQGAKSLIQRHADCLELMATGDPGVLQDVDFPHDLLGRD